MSSVFLRFYIFKVFQGRAMHCGQTVTAQRCTDLKRRRSGAQSEMQVATINLNAILNMCMKISTFYFCAWGIFSLNRPLKLLLFVFFSVLFFPPCRLSPAKERLHCHMFAFKSSVQRHTKTRRRLKRISRIIANKKPNFATEKGWLTFRSPAYKELLWLCSWESFGNPMGSYGQFEDTLRAHKEHQRTPRRHFQNTSTVKVRHIKN